MRILVTGATGFIGQSLIAALNGHEIIGVARSARDVPDVQWVVADLSEPGFVDRLPSRVDAVVHAVQSPLYRQFPFAANEVFAVNVASTQTLLDWSVTHGVMRFVYLSSGSVYEPYDGSLTEDAALHPHTHYSASKLAGELLVAAYGGMMRCVSLRLFFPYGPGQRERLIPRLVKQVRQGQAIDLAGENGMAITPVHVDDVVRVIREALSRPEMHGAVNLAGGEVLTLREIVQMIAERLGTEAHFYRRSGEAPRIVPDLQRLQRFVDPSSFRSFDQGLDGILEQDRATLARRHSLPS